MNGVRFTVNQRCRRFVRKIRRAILRDEPTYYDMFENRGERYFARLYLHQINQTIRNEGFSAPLKILDAGCQTGRLAIPLSQAGHHVTGVDTSGLALRRLKRHADECGTSLRLIRANLTRWLPKQSDHCFDVVVCTEVLYLRENYRQILTGLIRLLRPGGLLFISHRPTGYYLAEAFQLKDLEAARLVATKREGILWGSYYNWQDRQGLDHLYRDLQISPIAMTPIGLLSWLAVNPEELNQSEQDLLFEAETAAAQRYRESGRYLLVCGRKT